MNHIANKTRSLFLTALASSAMAVVAQAAPQVPPRPVGLPPSPLPTVTQPPLGVPTYPPPRPVGLPMGLPPSPYTGPYGLPPVGLPPTPVPKPGPVQGLPVPPRPIGAPPIAFTHYDLVCTAVVGNRSGFRRVELKLKRLGPGDFQARGHMRFHDGSNWEINGNITGIINRGALSFDIPNVGYLRLRKVLLVNGQYDFRGDVALFRILDRNGLSCVITPES